jgi:hypothetical protein
MYTGKSFLAGVVGGAVMSVLLALGRAMGMEANLEMMLGTMMGMAPGTTTWIVGFVIHLIVSGLIACLYALAFEYVTHRSGWAIGAGFSTIHIVIAGMVMDMIPAMHPMVPEQMPAPGAFMSNIEMGPIAFVIEHLIYGAIVGGMYKPVVHMRSLRTREAM